SKKDPSNTAVNTKDAGDEADENQDETVNESVSVTKTKKTSRSKTQFTFDFTSKITVEEKKKLKKAFAASEKSSSNTMSKTALVSRDTHTLPEDVHYDLNSLLRPFNVPQSVVLFLFLQLCISSEYSPLYSCSADRQ